MDKQIVELLPTIIEYYKNNELSVDVLHINRIPFLGLVSKNIHYRTVNPLDNMKISTMEIIIDKILCAYLVCGFHVVLLHMDIQFKALKDDKNLDVQVNVVARGEHVPKIEHVIHVWKERAHYYYVILLAADIDTIPHTMVMQLMIMIMVNFYVNTFVLRLVESQILPPLTIVEGIIVWISTNISTLSMEITYRCSREQ